MMHFCVFFFRNCTFSSAWISGCPWTHHWYCGRTWGESNHWWMGKIRRKNIIINLPFSSFFNTFFCRELWVLMTWRFHRKAILFMLWKFRWIEKSPKFTNMTSSTTSTQIKDFKLLFPPPENKFLLFSGAAASFYDHPTHNMSEIIITSRNYTIFFRLLFESC